MKRVIRFCARAYFYVCLFLGILQVERSLVIKVTFQNAKGKTVTKKFRDWEARIFQHEYDHLDGVVYIDRLLPESKEKVCLRNDGREGD